jgi:hypothetical protein
MKKRPLPTELISPKGDLRADVRNDLPLSDSRTGRVPETKVRFKCGHSGRTFSAVCVFGDTIYLLPAQIHEQGQCADCVIAEILKGSIRCALCGKLIRDESIVALYQDNGGFREDAMRVTAEGKKCVIGCTQCIPNAAFLSGTWVNGRYSPATIIIEPHSSRAIALPEELAAHLKKFKRTAEEDFVPTRGKGDDRPS